MSCETCHGDLPLCDACWTNMAHPERLTWAYRTGKACSTSTGFGYPNLTHVTSAWETTFLSSAYTLASSCSTAIST